jgi:hypothetical protein
VVPDDRLEEEVELELLDRVRRRAGGAFAQRDSHTRNSDTSCSVSTGLVM